MSTVAGDRQPWSFFGSVGTQEQDLGWRCLLDQQAMGSKPRSCTEDYERQVVERQVVDLVAIGGRTATAVAAEGACTRRCCAGGCGSMGQAGGKVEAPRPPAPSKLLPVPAPTYAARQLCTPTQR